MPCSGCASVKQRKFPSEIAVHYVAPDGMSQALIFPELKVCTDCGLTEFTVSQEELRLLAADGADVRCVSYFLRHRDDTSGASDSRESIPA
jgi:hypothetical protein